MCKLNLETCNKNVFKIAFCDIGVLLGWQRPSGIYGNGLVIGFDGNVIEIGRELVFNTLQWLFCLLWFEWRITQNLNE